MSEEMSFGFEFSSPITVQEIKEAVEGSPSKAIITGTLIAEGVTKNGNLYTIEEIEHIAREMVGKDVYFGIIKDSFVNGMPTKQKHADNAEDMIGKVISTSVDKEKGKAYYVAEIMNTVKNTDIVSKIKTGWGNSIGGFVAKAHYVFDKFGKLCMKIKDMIVDHLCIIPPSIVRGQDIAKIESIQVQEVMNFVDVPSVPEPIMPPLDVNIKFKAGKNIKFL
jgi:hypothetical protein